jgi:hypothetical protein
MSAAYRARRWAFLATAGSATLAACGGSEPAVVFDDPIVLAEDGGSQPTTIVLSDGRMLTAWVGQDHNVWLRASDEAEARRVNDVDGDAAPHAQAPAQVAAGPDGSVYVVWHNETPIAGRRFPASDLRFARSDDGGRTFEPAITVNDDAGGPPTSHTFQDLLVTETGTVVVSWIDSRAREARAEETGAGSEHTGAGHRATPEGTGAGASAAPDPGPSRRGPEIRVARSLDRGRTFSASTVVSVDACPCCRTAMATGPDGAIYLAWRHIFDGNVRDIVVSRSDDGGASFGAPRKVHDDGWVFDGCPHAGPSLTVTPGGELHVAWYTGEEGNAGLFHAASADRGETFGPPNRILTGDWVPPSTARLSATPDGAVWLAWEDTRTADATIHVSRLRGTGTISAGSVTFSGRGPDMPPIAPSGVVLAYLASDGDGVLATRAPGRRNR